MAEEKVLSFHLADVAPHGQVFEEHLEVVVILATGGDWGGKGWGCGVRWGAAMG